MTHSVVLSSDVQYPVTVSLGPICIQWQI